MTRLRIDLAYDGGPFAGFARQPGQDTVQGTLEGALRRLTGLDLDLTCAGRTDRGVHALAQVVHLDLDPAPERVRRFLADLGATRRRLDRLTGPAVTIWAVTEVDDTFDARFSATGRAYRYRIVDTPLADPRLRGMRWQLGESLDVAAMAAAAPAVLGEHDFGALCRRAEGKHTVRRVDAIAVERVQDPVSGVVDPASGVEGALGRVEDPVSGVVDPASGVEGALGRVEDPVSDGEIHVTMQGPAFCHQQVRSTVGCLVAIGRGRRPVGWLADVIASRDRATAADVAPPEGLTLERVTYPDPWPDAPPPLGR